MWSGGGTNFWKENNSELEIVGMDISKTAIEKARKSYPNIRFLVGNISGYREELAVYDACLFAEVMWYILGDLDRILKNLNYFFRGKTVMINQTFYAPGIQQYGKEYFTNLDEMCEYLPWKCLEKIVEENLETGNIDTHSVFRIE